MSAPKRQLVVSPRARADLRNILRYTGGRWGSQQRAAYKAQLNQAMRGLIAHPDRGRPRDDFSPGLHALPVAAHVVYYRVDEREISIVRVLHGAMDAAAVFQAEPRP